MFRVAVPRNLLLPWIAGQVGVFLPLLALAEAWLVALDPGLFVDPARVTDWGQVLNGPLTGLMPSFARPIAAVLFLAQFVAAWLYGAVWLAGDRRATGATGFWTLPSGIVLTGIPLALFLAVFGAGGTPWAGLPLALVLLAVVLCVYLQPVLVLLYVGRRLRGGERFARRWTVPLAATSVVFAVGVFGLIAAATTPQQRLSALLRRVDADARDRNGRTLVHYAVSARDQGTLGTVMKSGADANPRDERGETPLFLLAQRAREDDGSVAKALLGQLQDGGANLNARNVRDETPLYRAVELSDLAIARALLDAGADPNLADREGRTPLHVAARRRDAVGASLLIRYDARTDRPDAKGDTPAVYARRLRDANLLGAMGLELPPVPTAVNYPLASAPAPEWPGAGQDVGTTRTPRR
ncbi:MAG TPA: ankyrin repeat domain-containing protein [Armatimonadaceae bacterium]|nr:ankyrin repeat domain-containing protein [Armatimonadaceae bacterium]